jgi:tetratricopeptide (TPR) repeat protein
MSKPFAAYRGSEPYVFVCYSHQDSERVYADLLQLKDQGINIWYDEGIPAGSSWRAEIAAAIQGASRLLFFISETSLVSSHCLREVDFAVNHDIEIVPVYLDESVLPAELELVLNRVHALFREQDPRYMEHLLEALHGRTPRIAALVRKKKSNSLMIGLVLAGIALVILAWAPWKGPTGTRQGLANIVAPSGYNNYLEGLDLLERWYEGDNLEVAAEKFREATLLDPGFALAYARLGDALRMRYLLTRDDALLDEAAENVNAAVGMNPDLSPVQVALGRVLSAQGNHDLAHAAINKAISIDPNDPNANSALAAQYVRLGRLEDAEAAYRKAVALDPENVASLEAYAHFLNEQGRYQESAEQWRAVIGIAPDHFAALVNLGGVLVETGKISEAITVYQRAIELRPSYMAYSNLGTAYSRAERYADAAAAYRAALDIDDSDWLVWGNLAYVYSWMDGEDDKAAETFARAIELAEAARDADPRDFWAPSDLGLYYAKTGEPELAVQRTDTALALSEDATEVYAAAAEVYELIGQRDRAVELAQKALDLGYSRRQFLRNPEMVELLADPRLQARL